MKKIIIYLLVIVAIISLSSVSATENITDNIDVDTEDNILISHNNDIELNETNDISYSENTTFESKNITMENLAGDENTNLENNGDINSNNFVSCNDNVYTSKNMNNNTVSNENTVTADTFFNYFDEEGTLRNNITVSDLIFEGNFTELNVSNIIINKKINLIGENALLKNTGILIKADNVVVSNFTIFLNKNGGSAISITGVNASIQNNIFAIDGNNVNEDIFAIYAKNADNLNIDTNIIGLNANFNKTNINNAIRIIDSNNVNIVRNSMLLFIPSVSTVLSEGIHVEGSTNFTFDSNYLFVDYYGVSGTYDAIYALDVVDGDNAIIKNNNITLNGHSYTYAININGKNITIDSNFIDASSDNNYVNGIMVQKESTGIVKSNKFDFNSPIVAYGIYSNKINNISYVNNTIKGNSSYIYGIYVSGYKETLLNNTISLKGNFTIGIASSADLLFINECSIVNDANNIGNASSCGDSIIAEDTGVKIVRGNVIVANCNIKTYNGTYAVNTTGAGSVIYNNLVSTVGLGDYAVSANNQTIVLNNTPKFQFNVPILGKIYGSDDKLTASLIDGQYNPIVNATVTFNLNGKNYEKTTNASGIAAMSINLNPGFYRVNATYNNTTVKSEVIVLSSIWGKNVVKIYQNGTQFSATFYNSDSSPLINTQVSFNINGVLYNKTTNANGIAKLSINLRPGEYILTAINPSNGEQKGFNITVLPNIETQNLVKYYKNGTQFVVKVLNKNGTPATGTNITFNINGVYYSRPVVNGTAQLSINLNPGEYIITTSYEGYEVGNNISIKPTLITEDLSMNYKDGSTFNATVLDGQGKPLANQVVIFNVNGVFYNRTSGDDGIASLNINLNKGKYIITSMWNNYQVGNKITIA
jgi:hypothetical protein